MNYSINIKLTKKIIKIKNKDQIIMCIDHFLWFIANSKGGHIEEQVVNYKRQNDKLNDHYMIIKRQKINQTYKSD